jgi:phospholipase C
MSHDPGARPIIRMLAAALLCAGTAGCFSTGFGSGLVGDLGGLGRGEQVKADGIRGTVLDLTGSLAAVQDERSKTIFEVVVTEAQRGELAPGMIVEVSGSMKDGVLRGERVRISGGTPWPETRNIGEDQSRIEHVIFLLQENHSFDNYFGTFPGVDGIPPGITVEETQPFHQSSPRTGNLPHGRTTVMAAEDGGAMDRFVSAERSRETMGYYDGTDIPNYWAYARHFALADRFFCSSTGPSLPNHLFALAAQAGRVVSNSIRAPAGGYSFASLAQKLEAAGVSWNVYDGRAHPASFSSLDPFSGFASFMTDEALRSRLVPNARLFRDLVSGGLPAAAWVFPNPEESEHPMTDIRVGMWYVTAVVNALMKSPYWGTTVLVVSWDEYGGYYDHVPPPVVDEQGYGLRVPALIISSRAREGYVDHTEYDFSSVLRFMEKQLGVDPLSTRDANARDIGGSLDMARPPLRPLLIGAPEAGTASP